MHTETQNAPLPLFDGAAFDRRFDQDRLAGQIRRVFDAMRDGRYRTLPEIEAITGDGQASVSAQLRNLRKERFGGHTVDKRSRGDRSRGLFEYQLRIRDLTI